jgi:hypothetical protein
MQSIKRIAIVANALIVCGCLSGCFYSHTVEKDPPSTVVTTAPDKSTTTTTTRGPDGTVERQSTTTYSNP